VELAQHGVKVVRERRGERAVVVLIGKDIDADLVAE
jgi:hypothetical protein